MFYFADTSDRPIIDVFTPRIPISRMCYEDAITPRICLSTSLEGCFSAAPWGGEGLDINPKSVVYRIYEFDDTNIPPKNIVTTEYLTGMYSIIDEEPLVPDAEFTNEVWVVNKDLQPDNIYYVVVDKYDLMPICTTKNCYVPCVKNLECHNVHDISFVKEIKLDGENVSSVQAGWLNYVLEFYTYFPYSAVDIEKKGAKLKIIFPSPQAREHMDELSKIVKDAGGQIIFESVSPFSTFKRVC